MPQQPTGLVKVSEEIGLVVFQFTGVLDATTYNVYRSTDPTQLGTIINIAPIDQVASPFIIVFTDDGIATTSAPIGPDPYFYRVAAVDGSGNSGLASDALEVNVNYAQDITPARPHLTCVEHRG